MSRLSAPLVRIDPKVLEKVAGYRQSNGEPEAGGILLGIFYPGINEMLICFATTPGPEDKRSRFGFRRDGYRSTRKAKYLWKASGGVVNYLGEWHTHPEDAPQPSTTDRLSMGKQLRESTVIAGGLLLMIVGREGIWLGYFSRGGFCQIGDGLLEMP